MHMAASVRETRTVTNNSTARPNLNKSNSQVSYSNQVGEGGHSGTRGTVVFFDSFKKLKTLNFKLSMVI